MTTQPGKIPTHSSAETWFVDHARLAAVAVLLAGLLARLWAASGTFLNADEALHFRLANQVSLADVYRASLTESHPPLLYWLLYFERGLAGSELWLRLPSVIAGTVFCWIFFRWLTQVTGRVSSFVGLMLVALLPPVVRLSAEVRQYALLLAFLAGALYFLERALAEDSWWLMAASALCLYLAMLSHYSALFFVAGLGVYALLKILVRGSVRPRSSRVVTIWVAGQIGALVLLVFLYKTHLSHLGQGESRTVVQGWMSEYYLSRSYFEAGRDNLLLFAIGHSFAVFQFVFGQLAVGDLAGVMFVVAAGLLWRGKPENTTASRPLVVFLVLLFALACGASLAHIYPYGGTRHTAYLIIPAVTGVSVAVSRFVAERWTRGVAIALVIVAICALFGQQHQPYMTRANQSRKEMNSAIAFLRENVAPAGLIFTDFESSLILGHYLCDEKPVLVQASSQQFETFSCSGYRVVSANRRTATYFFPEIFFSLWKPFLEIYSVKAGDPVWIFQAGWGVDLAERLRSQSPAFRDLPFRAFGNNIKGFKLTAGRDIAAETPAPTGMSVLGPAGKYYWAGIFNPRARTVPSSSLALPSFFVTTPKPPE